MSKLKFILLRVFQTFILLFLILTALFWFFRLMPGDYSDIMTFRGATPEQVAEFEEQWGLNEPLYVQYFQYMSNFLTGDFGNSTQAREPVWDFVSVRILNSFILVAPGITLGYIFGSIFGTLIGMRRGEKVERFGLIVALAIGSVPIFFTAIVFIIIFSGWLGLFPTAGMGAPQEVGRFDAWWRSYFTFDFVRHYVLPLSVIALTYTSLPTLIMRTSVVEVMGQDFIKYYKATGMSHYRRTKQIMKHASLPIITLYPVSMTRAIGGLVLLEFVFNWPGIGFTLVEAVFVRDYAVVQFIFFLIAVFIILSNLIVDIVYSVIDPRVSVETDTED